MARLTGKFVWFECVTNEAGKAKAFYTELFGWKVQPFAMGEESYEMLTVGPTPVGGFAQPDPGAPPHWTSYLSVPDVDATLEKVRGEGGAVLKPAFDVPVVGRMAQVADPQGASFWVMAGSEDDTPDLPPAQGLFQWNELWARDGEKAVRFYEKIAGYTTRTMPMPEGGTYYLLERDGVPRAGVMTSPRSEVPPMWLPYVGVDDCDATVSRAQKLGGSVHVPATDIPGVGRFAILGDPLGATIAIIKPIAKTGA
jgi:predicted enzyme related to lactoylglutathione lyase